MPAKPNKQLAILQRRRQVAALYVQGWSQADISEHLAISQPSVSDDLKCIRQEWRESAIRDFDDVRDLQLQKLDRLEREAWDAWERSKKPQQSAVVREHSGQQSTHKTMRQRVGDPRFMDQINKCIAQRRAILGLDAIPTMTEQNADVSITVDARRTRFVTLVAGLRDRGGTAADGTRPTAALPGDVRVDNEPREVAPGQAPGLP
jgi:hypothetical protein